MMNFLRILNRKNEETCPLLFNVRKKNPVKGALTGISKKAVFEVLCTKVSEIKWKTQFTKKFSLFIMYSPHALHGFLKHAK